jgi:nitrogen fixation protein FixH
MQKRFRNPWPIAIIIYFVVFICGIGVFVTWAVRQKMDLVQKDYYDQELDFQKQIDAAARARQMKDLVAISYDAKNGQVLVQLPPVADPSTIAGRLRFYRPSDASLDCEVPLALSSAGAQRVDAGKLKPGLWKVRAYWRVNALDYYYDDVLLVSDRETKL